MIVVNGRYWIPANGSDEMTPNKVWYLGPPVMKMLSPFTYSLSEGWEAVPQQNGTLLIQPVKERYSMSANIYVRQITPLASESISCWAPSSFITSIEKAFGSFPCRLGRESISKLEGMAAMCGDGGGNPYSEIIERIEQLGPVEVYAEC